MIGSSLEDRLGSPRAKLALVALLLLFLAITAALLGHPATRQQARPWLLFENSPVELLTFAFFLLGGLAGLRLALGAWRAQLGALTVAFYVVYSIGLVFIAGEEVAWGQWFFHWQTPEEWRAVNVQGETTLHNVPGLNDVLPVLHILFAAGALVGIAARRVRPLRWLATPGVLAPWFALVLVHQLLELATAIAFRGSVQHKLFERTSEVVEMYLAIAAWLYVFLNARRLRREASLDDPGSRAA